MEDIFGDLFGNMFGGRSSRSSNRRQDGADLLYRMTISFDEAIEFIMNNDNYANFIVGSFHVYGTTISKLNNLKDCSYE